MKRIFLVLLLVIASLGLKAQEIHYSQFYAVPMTLNPALTGFSNSPFRVSGIYRSQWASFAPFTTQSFSAEFSPNVWDRDDPGFQNKLGLGLMFTNDQAGTDVGLRTTKIHGSIAYNMLLAKDLYLGAGIQLGYVQRVLYGEHVGPSNWDPVAQSMDGTMSGLATNVSYLDPSVGFNSAYTFDQGHSLFLGGAMFHVTRGLESFIGDAAQRAPIRNVLHFGARYQLGASAFSLVPNAIYMGVPNTGAREWNVGLDVDIKRSSNTANQIFTIGGYWREGDAIIAHASIGDGVNWALGLSYDINYSDLQLASNNNGGFEVALKLGLPFTRKEVGLRAPSCPNM